MADREDLREFKDQVQLKKVVFGGYDKKDVQLKFDVFYEMVERYMDKQKKEFDAKIASLTSEFEQKQKAAEILMAEMNENINSLTEENEAMVMKQHKMKEAYKEYCETLLQQYSGSLCSLSNEFTRLMGSVETLQKEIMSKDINEGLNRMLEMKGMPDLLEGKKYEE